MSGVSCNQPKSKPPHINKRRVPGVAADKLFQLRSLDTYLARREQVRQKPDKFHKLLRAMDATTPTRLRLSALTLRTLDGL
jgi:hypothetical protein